MKKLLIVSAALLSTMVLTACGDDASSASLADKCKTLSKGCLAGTWDLQSKGNFTDKATLTFKGDKFSYKPASIDVAYCDIKKDGEEGINIEGTYAILDEETIEFKLEGFKKTICFMEAGKVATKNAKVTVSETDLSIVSESGQTIFANASSKVAEETYTRQQ